MSIVAQQLTSVFDAKDSVLPSGVRMLRGDPRQPSTATTAYTLTDPSQQRNALPANQLTSRIATFDKSLAETVFDRNAQHKIAFLQVSMHFEPRWRERMFVQLDRLLDPQEWIEEDALSDEQSFKTLLRLLHVLKPQRAPGLGLSSTGNFVASWSCGKDHLTIECRPADELLWSCIIMLPQQQVASGDASVTRISTALTPFNTERWFQDRPIGEQANAAG